MRPNSSTVRVDEPLAAASVTVTSVGDRERRAGRARAPSAATASMSASVRAAHTTSAPASARPDAHAGADALARAGDDRDAAVEPELDRGSRVRLLRVGRRRTLASSPHGRCGEGNRRSRAGAPGARARPTTSAYHDDEWGRPVVDDTRLYEKLCLEGFQSGLSWLTILRKRENFRPRVRRASTSPSVARLRRDATSQRLLQDAGIVRHRGKIEATIANAHATFVAVEEQHGSLAGARAGRSSRRVAARRRARSATSRRRPTSRRRCSKELLASRIPLRRPDDRLRDDAVARASSTITSSDVTRARAVRSRRARSLSRPAPSRSRSTISALPARPSARSVR